MIRTAAGFPKLAISLSDFESPPLRVGFPFEFDAPAPAPGDELGDGLEGSLVLVVEHPT
jgi:hypothetical protein